MLEKISSIIQKQIPSGIEAWSARIVNSSGNYVRVRQNVLEPIQLFSDNGVYISLTHHEGTAYAATDDLSESGIKQAISYAMQWAECGKHLTISSHGSNIKNSYTKKAKIDADLHQQIDFLTSLNKELNIHEHIVDWASSIQNWTTQSLFINHLGGEIYQEIDYLIPSMYALANQGTESQRRSAAGSGLTGGMEQLTPQGMNSANANTIANQALQLLDAENCPTKTCDLILMPSQMMLQIHESIGHPLELDRILGDERNYAGTSFVDLSMFGHYQYGSSLLNITFAPDIKDELASFAFDDEGSSAEKVHIIENGILQRPLGGASSQQRGTIHGTANARACNWNRPPIDRMANLNLEPGAHSLQDMISQTEYGVLMDTNLSWSIDDSRNKFQFGCELGQLIIDGEAKQLLKNPNYRGISANFWRNLAMVGNRESFEIWGTPNCGKGEPNQMIHVGHASPPCLFNNTQVFGGD